MGHLKKKNTLPIMSTIKLEGIEDSIPTGAKFGKIHATLGDAVELNSVDNDTLKDQNLLSTATVRYWTFTS